MKNKNKNHIGWVILACVLTILILIPVLAMAAKYIGWENFPTELTVHGKPDRNILEPGPEFNEEIDPPINKIIFNKYDPDDPTPKPPGYPKWDDPHDNVDWKHNGYIRGYTVGNIYYVLCKDLIYMNPDGSEHFDFSKKIVDGVKFGEGSQVNEIVFNNMDTTLTHTMKGMYSSNVNLVKITNMNKFDTSNVTDMSEMFRDCKKLGTIDLSTFNTQKVQDMGGMFYHCEQVKELDVSQFGNSAVTNMENMFAGCSALESLNLAGFTTSQVQDMGAMFEGCSSLKSINTSSFDTKNVENMQGMFSDCSQLQSMDLSKFKTGKVVNMSWMFQGCTELQQVDMRQVDCAKTTDMSGMFYNCNHLTVLDLTDLDTRKVQNMNFMFQNCGNLQTVKINFNDAELQSAVGMFENCTGLQTIYSGQANLWPAVSHNDMFRNCPLLRGGQGTVYNQKVLDRTYARTDGGTAAPGYFTAL